MDSFRDAGDATLSIFGNDAPSPVQISPTELESGHGLVRGVSFKTEPEEMESNKAFVSFAPNRRAEGGRTVEGGVTIVKLTEENKKRHDRRTMNPNVHPLVQNFTSPIGMLPFDLAPRTLCPHITSLQT